MLRRSIGMEAAEAVGMEAAEVVGMAATAAGMGHM